MTIYDIAKQMNVSPATVSLALNNDQRVAEKTRLRVHAFAAEQGFMRNEQARNFRLQRSGNVAIVVHNIDNDFWYGVVRAVEQRLGEGYNVILCNTEGSLEKERKTFANLMRRKVDGVIVQPAAAEETHLLEMIHAGTVVVSLEKTDNEEISFVKGDDYKAAYDLTEECIRRGHRRIVFLTFHFPCIGLDERASGFRDAVKKHELQENCKVLEAQELSAESVSGLIHGHEKDHTLYLCSDDRLACILLKVLKDSGVSVPDEVSVCGWNDSRFLQYMSTPLSSVHIPMAEIGARAAEIICENLEKGPKVHKIRIEEKMILRDSFRTLFESPQPATKKGPIK